MTGGSGGLDGALLERFGRMHSQRHVGDELIVCSGLQWKQLDSSQDLQFSFATRTEAAIFSTCRPRMQSRDFVRARRAEPIPGPDWNPEAHEFSEVSPGVRRMAASTVPPRPRPRRQGWRSENCFAVKYQRRLRA
jgi:hypothetical protein